MLKLCAIGNNLTQLGSLPAHHHTNIPGVVFVLLICRFFRRHITTALWALYAVISKWLPGFFTHAWFPFSFTVCTMRRTWPYIFQPLTSSPTRCQCLDAKTPPISPSDSAFLRDRVSRPRPSPTALAPYLLRPRRSHRWLRNSQLPDHLQPRWPRIFYDHADRTADYVSFTPAQCWSLATSNPTDEPTHFSENDFWLQQYCLCARQLHIRRYRCVIFFWSAFSLRGSHDMSHSYGSHSTSNAAVPESPSRRACTAK